jgi:hypothetical protein
MTLHPTFVPFMPWTTLSGYIDLLGVLQELELIENVTPIQLGIRLLIPEGSRGETRVAGDRTRGLPGADLRQYEYAGGL